MNGFLGLFQLGLLFAFAAALTAALAGILAWPLAVRFQRALAPAARARFLLLYSLLPLLAAAAAVILGLLPSLLQLLGLGSDHCLGHDDGHVHFCLIHRPAPLAHWLQWLPGTGFLALLGTILLQLVIDLRESARFSSRLRAHPHRRRDGINVLESETPLALSCGLLRPQIWISTALLDLLAPAERDMVLAHERAHIERRDGWRLLLARAFSLAHFPVLRRRLLADLNLACELACDQSSCGAAGDPGKVAGLLLKIERLYRRHFAVAPSLAAHMHGGADSNLPARIESLLREAPPARPTVLRPWLPVSGLILLMLLSHDTIHDLLEHLAALLALH